MIDTRPRSDSELSSSPEFLHSSNHSLSSSASLSTSAPTSATSSPLRRPSGNRRRGNFTANPLVSAMLSSNNLNDCFQVKELYSKCQDTDSSHRICDAVVKRFVSCHRSEK